MGEGGRGNKKIEDLSASMRAQVDALIDSGVAITEIWESYPAVQTAISLRSLQDYAKVRMRERKVSIALDERAVSSAILDELGVDQGTLTKVERTLLGVAMRESLMAGKGTTKLNGVSAALQIFKHRRKESELSMITEKFDAWKADYQRREQQRLEEANREVAKYGEDNGLSEDAIKAIQGIYGIDGDGDGSA